MKSLKTIIISNLEKLSAVMIVLIILVATVLQGFILQKQARSNAEATFTQIEHILKENTEELRVIEAEYRMTCLLNAEAIAYMIEHNPEIIGDIEEFRDIARIMQVDEIHIFDETGRIFTGTHPEYYDFTVFMEGQINFFEPLLYDKNLKLCQDITPNTAEGKLVQYSALWSENEKFIVQVGMYPETVLEYTEKNELSYIFSLLQGSPGVTLYAINKETGEILGSTTRNDIGKNAEDIGMVRGKAGYERGLHENINGVDSYCIFKNMNGTIITYVISNDVLYNNVVFYTLVLAAAVTLIAIVIIIMIWKFTKKYIVASIDETNDRLKYVSEGNFDEHIDVKSSVEFAELSNHINYMIGSILSNMDKMGLVLNQTNLSIGVYEYSTKMKKVHFTEHIAEILGWSKERENEFSSDRQLFEEYVNVLRNEPVEGEKNVYRLNGERETYIKFEEVINKNDVLGIIMDVTDEILTRRRIEKERDIDLLTGLYNRRGMEEQLKAVFEGEPNYGAVIMIDADSLKYVNDFYGHSIGDRYIKAIADAIADLGSEKKIAARQGGDEFVLVIYDYSTEAKVMMDLEKLRYMQDNTDIYLEDGSKIPVKFSFGYVLIKDRKDIDKMLAEADTYMYNAKRMRKIAEAKKKDN